MARVSVKTAAGRVARTSPQGAFIPNDRYVGVQLTDYLQRRIDDGDVELEPEKKTGGKDKPAAPAPVASE